MPLPPGFKLEESSATPIAPSLPAGYKLEPESFNTFKMLMNAPSSLYENTLGGLVQIATNQIGRAHV